MRDEFQIDISDILLISGASLLIGTLFFLMHDLTIASFVFGFAVGAVGTTSYVGHKSKYFQLFGIFAGIVIGVGVSISKSLAFPTATIIILASGILGYVFARWGYHLLDSF